ncbi:MAG: hypothetical protein Q7T45_06595 [Bradyrhizobium sp.]|uniref:hypothetical protein n=1 Tax=Bradyrhizobium sp. TaxID=376 RepID=UPI00271D7C95|nr:hypothetical protein [Bradyrhizobium sp.]MDO8397471.1 hypothetical protein [Bradyrhizobium sp.]
MIARALRPARIAAALQAILVAALLAFHPAPARASDAGDCVASLAKAAISAPELEAAYDFLSHPENFPCLALLADPTFEFHAIVAVLIAIKQAGAFDTVDQCRNLIPSITAEVVLGVADKLGISIPDDIRKDSQKLAQWITDNALGQIVTQEIGCGCAVAVYGIEGLEKSLANLKAMAESCGAVLQEIASVIAEGVKGALSAIEDFINGVVDAFEDVFDAIAGGDDLPTTSAPPKGDVACYPPSTAWCLPDSSYCSGSDPAPVSYYKCPADLKCTCQPGPGGKPQLCASFDPAQSTCPVGSQCAADPAWLAWHNATPMGQKDPWSATNWRTWLKCMPCEGVANAVPLTAGVCGCAAGYQPVYQFGPSGKKTLTACLCPAPMQEGSFFGSTKSCQCPSLGQVPRMSNGKLVCGCPDNYQLEGGLCRACTSTEIYDAKQLACVHCPIGQKPDPARGSNTCVNLCKPGEILQGSGCQACPANTYAKYMIGSTGSCEPCPAGSTAKPGSTACLAPPVYTPPPPKSTRPARQPGRPDLGVVPRQPPVPPVVRPPPRRPPVSAPPQRPRPIIAPVQRLKPAARPHSRQLDRQR